MPEAGNVKDAIAACPFVVVSDVTADTDTCRVADVLLPALAWGEKSGTVTNSERRISRQRSLLRAPGGARPDPDPIVPGDAARTLAAEALAWGAALGDRAALSDYEHNLVVICHAGVVEWRTVGLAASIVSAYQRAAGQEAERALRAETSRHFGTVGERGEFEVYVTGIVAHEGNYGTTLIHKMLDRAGNAAVWFGTSGRLPEREWLRVKATVKAHDQRQGVAQTVLTRCKAVEAATDGNERAA